MRRTFLHFSREGWPFILLSCVVAYATWYLAGPWLAVPFALLVLLLFVLFHDPARDIPPLPLAVVAPVDGKVLSVDDVHDPFLNRGAKRIRLQVSPFAGYSFRAAVEGTLVELPPEAREATNCKMLTWIRTDENDDVLMHVSQGNLLGNRPCTLAYGQRVGQGRRCGMRRLAREIDVYLAETTRVDAKPGDKTRAGETVLATLVHKESES